jgi:NADH:ubiquinone oxidoreductase subunit F (NADH-binding)/NADH:ubiquinone oxidoreductase subunit E/NAD-dependent dihydropyrimidine dehydrogenase PreA subunit
MKPETEQVLRIVEDIVARRGRTMDATIPILQDIQAEFNYLPEEALEHVCKVSDITPARIQGIATFYAQFRHEPAGRHIIRVCVGTACHVKGSGLVFDAFRRELGLKDNHVTDADGNFTIEKVACLGCCTLAPVVKIDEVTYGHVNPEKVGEVIRDFLSKKDQGNTSEQTGIRNHESQGEIRIGLGSCCIASGSLEVKNELERTLAETRIQVDVKQVGCVGICNQVPIMEIVKPGESPSYYAHIKPEEVRDVILRHFKPKKLIHRLRNALNSRYDKVLDEESPPSFRKYLFEQRDTPLSGFLGPQFAIATENRGVIKPCDILEYKQSGGFTSLKHCLDSLSPVDVIEEIRKSGLRGRGGAGFPTGDKWLLVHEQAGSEKYLICNGDEGDPGAFMDRMLLESYPYRIIEGMLIAGYAIKASAGMYYIRAEYPLALERIREAIMFCREEGLIGKNILGTSFSFEISIFEGAGAFVCGEETALIASIEGNRGIPSLRPPYPAIQGLWDKPTLVNNVETYANIPWIIRNGSSQLSSIGSEKSKGTKVFALAGKINRGGLIEVPMGITLRQIIEDIGGGIAGGRKFKAVQVGGPSGGCIPSELIDLPVDYESLSEAGAMMGSGGMVVLDETDCMVDIAHYFLSFTQDQSCGQCTFCRIGTRRMLELLEKVRSGHAGMEDLDKLEHLALSTRMGSICGLGRTAPNPVLSTLKYFREEYEAHVHGKCPSGKCTPLIRYSINNDCIGCTKCSQRCPADAIPYAPYEVHTIDPEKCIKCDICRQVCPVVAVTVS